MKTTFEEVNSNPNRKRFWTPAVIGNYIYAYRWAINCTVTWAISFLLFSIVQFSSGFLFIYLVFRYWFLVPPVLGRRYRYRDPRENLGTGSHGRFSEVNRMIGYVFV